MLLWRQWHDGLNHFRVQGCEMRRNAYDSLTGIIPVNFILGEEKPNFVEFSSFLVHF